MLAEAILLGIGVELHRPPGQVLALPGLDRRRRMVGAPGGPAEPDGAAFVPIHAELRCTYWFAPIQLGKLRPYATLGGGLAHVGATPAEAASGLFVMSLSLAVLNAAIAWRTRVPLSFAWSTPGVAFLLTIAPVDGGFPAVGASAALARWMT